MLTNQLIENVDSVILPSLQTCKQLLAKHYGEKLQGVILFGSAARNDMTQESDLDLLVLLLKPFDYFEELQVIVDILYDTQLEAKYWISAKPAAKDEFMAGTIQLYRNIQEEGIFL
ncbi:MAG: nucleotidyltransferase domain-containing protein [Cyanobacteria bacterium J06649_4]